MREVWNSCRAVLAGVLRGTFWGAERKYGDTHTPKKKKVRERVREKGRKGERENRGGGGGGGEGGSRL